MLTRREILLGAAAAATALLRAQSSTAPGGPACPAHVVCDAKAFPMFAGRTYTPDPAPVAELLALHRALNIERVVFVQPSVYGTDNTCVLAAIREVGSHARGIAVIDDKTSDAAIDEMQRIGIRGIRINLETV